MIAIEPRNRDRIVAAAGAATVQGALLYALIVGLGVDMPAVVGEALKSFTVAPDAPPPPPEKIAPAPVRSAKREGAASPPNIRSKATEVVAPTPIVVIPTPPPIIAAPVAGVGADASAGASDRPGPGTGSGGIGDGTGSGGAGDGEGAGGREMPPRRKRGRIRGSDYPQAAAEAGISGTVSVRYRVETSGLTTGCVVTRSSGSALLDETTCRLIEQRYRYDPARDEDGRPVPSYIVHDESWFIDRVPAPSRSDDR